MCNRVNTAFINQLCNYLASVSSSHSCLYNVFSTIYLIVCTLRDYQDCYLLKKFQRFFNRNLTFLSFFFVCYQMVSIFLYCLTNFSFIVLTSLCCSSSNALLASCSNTLVKVGILSLLCKYKHLKKTNYFLFHSDSFMIKTVSKISHVLKKEITILT